MIRNHNNYKPYFIDHSNGLQFILETAGFANQFQVIQQRYFVPPCIIIIVCPMLNSHFALYLSLFRFLLELVLVFHAAIHHEICLYYRLGGWGAVHICTRQSSAQLQQVIVKHNHGHLFLLLDIIMGIPIQAQAIPVNSCNVKARLRYIESDASKSDTTSQIDDLTNSTVQSSLLHTTLPQHWHLPAREDGKTRLWESNILTKRRIHLCPETMYKSLT